MADMDKESVKAQTVTRQSPEPFDAKDIPQPETKSGAETGISIMDSGPEETRLLNLIARLRRQNVEDHYGIPQIVMCGYQSTGKSSVLEAITEIPFPTDVSLCTKCVTAVTLSEGTSKTKVVEVTIEPSRDSPQERIKRLRKFRRGPEDIKAWDTVKGFLQDAEKSVLEGMDKRKSITKDVVHVKISILNRKPLQLYDLPGLMGIDDDEGRVKQDAETIMGDYMAKPRAIILAVVRAKSDSNNAEMNVLDWCRKEYDPDGNRSMCVLTHPDESGKHTKDWLAVFSTEELSKTYGFKGQWHVLRNWPRSTGVTSEHRDQKELEFFRDSPWSAVEVHKRGAKALTDRLRKLLFSNLKQCLPEMSQRLQQQLQSIEHQLKELSGPEDDSKRLEGFRYKLEKLKQQATDYSRGTYDEYISQNFPDGSKKVPRTESTNVGSESLGGAAWLGSRIVDEGEQFRQSIHFYGHTWESLISRISAPRYPDLTPPAQPTGPVPEKWKSWKRLFDDPDTEAREASQTLIARRGQPSLWHQDFNRIQEFFWRMSENWHEISLWHVEVILKYCREYCKLMVADGFARQWSKDDICGFANAKVVAQRYVSQYVAHELARRESNALKQLDELNEDRKRRIFSFDVSYLGMQREYSDQQFFTSNRKAQLVHHNSKKTQTNEAIEPLEARNMSMAGKRHDQMDHIQSYVCEFVHAAVSYYQASAYYSAVRNSTNFGFAQSVCTKRLT
ncbi:hypothetical protein ACHAPJ_007746 [Fusarium lateritium]